MSHWRVKFRGGSGHSILTTLLSEQTCGKGPVCALESPRWTVCAHESTTVCADEAQVLTKCVCADGADESNPCARMSRRPSQPRPALERLGPSDVFRSWASSPMRSRVPSHRPGRPSSAGGPVHGRAWGAGGQRLTGYRDHLEETEQVGRSTNGRGISRNHCCWISLGAEEQGGSVIFQGDQHGD